MPNQFRFSKVQRYWPRTCLTVRTLLPEPNYVIDLTSGARGPSTLMTPTAVLTSCWCNVVNGSSSGYKVVAIRW